MRKLSLGLSCFVCIFCAIAAVATPTDILMTLKSFKLDQQSLGTLVQGLDGRLYGTTYVGGAHNAGVVYRITDEGESAALYSFCAQPHCTDGGSPVAGLVQATNGNFYGTTSFGGGANRAGTVFKITPKGELTTLYSFCAQPNCADGGSPNAGLVQATNGNFYGTTGNGGAHDYGTVFKITPKGELTTLYSFCAQPNCTDGGYPGVGGLVQATNGNFYGTTESGGAHTNGLGGTVFKITPKGELTTLYSFCAHPNCTDGQGPVAGLVQATNGNFYGTTESGGANTITPEGTVFKITPKGELTTLYSFCSPPSCTDGGYPVAGLIQATDGNFYGTTEEGGANGSWGTVFRITPKGELTTLHSFCAQPNCTDGANPGVGGLVQATNGNFYGTTELGGANGNGTVFGLATGLGPFVATLPSSGQVGTSVRILGNNLTGASSVTFNGAPANFTVVSKTNIATTVPNDATSGKVVVTTPSGTLTSNVNFRIAPTFTSFLPTSGSVGTSVVLTGVKFSGATHVSFGGVQATSFTVDSDTQITATVPSGASTGRIGVITPGGRTISSESFRVG